MGSLLHFKTYFIVVDVPRKFGSWIWTGRCAISSNIISKIVPRLYTIDDWIIIWKFWKVKDRFYYWNYMTESIVWALVVENRILHFLLEINYLKMFPSVIKRIKRKYLDDSWKLCVINSKYKLLNLAYNLLHKLKKFYFLTYYQLHKYTVKWGGGWLLFSNFVLLILKNKIINCNSIFRGITHQFIQNVRNYDGKIAMYI